MLLRYKPVEIDTKTVDHHLCGSLNDEWHDRYLYTDAIVKSDTVKLHSKAPVYQKCHVTSVSDQYWY